MGVILNLNIEIEMLFLDAEKEEYLTHLKLAKLERIKIKSAYLVYIEKRIDYKKSLKIYGGLGKILFAFKPSSFIIFSNCSFICKGNLLGKVKLFSLSIANSRRSVL